MFRAKTIRGCLIDRTLDPSEASSQRQHTRSRTSHQVYTSRRRTSGVGQLPTTTTEPGVDARAGTPRRHRGATTKEPLARCNAAQIKLPQVPFSTIAKCSLRPSPIHAPVVSPQTSTGWRHAAFKKTHEIVEMRARGAMPPSQCEVC